MAVPRDPAFWKRFSTAVHLSDDKSTHVSAHVAQKLEDEDSWLSRQQAKKNRRTIICYIFWIGFFVLGAVVVGLIIWLAQQNAFGNINNAGMQSGKAPGS